MDLHGRFDEGEASIAQAAKRGPAKGSRVHQVQIQPSIFDTCLVKIFGNQLDKGSYYRG